MSLASDTLAWLDGHAADVAAHPGAAYAETEILRMLVTNTGPQGTGILAEAYARDVARRLPACGSRAEARSFAHYVMFGSDFGRSALAIAVGAGDALDSAVIEHAQDTDTLGELLIAAQLIGHQSAAITAARAVFDAAWQAMPRTDFDGYHPILVGGILYALTGD